MRRLKENDLIAIVDFIYNGEVNKYQEDLDRFLILAEELQLKGLTGSDKSEEENPNLIIPKPQTQECRKENIALKIPTREILDKSFKDLDAFGVEYKSIVPTKEIVEKLFKDNNSFGVEYKSDLPSRKISLASNIEKEDLKDQIYSMMERICDRRLQI